MFAISLLIMASMMCTGLSFCVPRIVRQRTPLLSTVRMALSMPAATSPKTTDDLDFQMLGELASKVVQGSAERVRKRSNMDHITS